MRTLLLLYFIALLLVPASAQKKQSLERVLHIYWSSKHKTAQIIADAVNFQPGDTIADIGTDTGFFTACMSMYGDSLTFFLEDIDATAWNRHRFDSALALFSSRSGQNPSNAFHHTIGTEQSTGLATGKFDKVLIVDTYHHFTYRDEMMMDAVRILKPGGTLAIMEAVARRPGDVHQGCRRNIFSEEEILSHMASMGVQLEEVKFVHKVAGRKNKLYLFSKP